MDLLPLATTFLLIVVGELGDKTQLAVISLSCNYKIKHVFLGAMLAFLVVDGVSAIIGGPLLALLPLTLVQVISGVVFIGFGIVPLLLGKKSTNLEIKNRFSTLPMLACFSLVALMELGDKTQLVTIALAAENPPLMVLVGLTLAFTLLTGAAVLVGAKLVSHLPLKWLKIGSSVLFVVLGSFSIANGLLGFRLF